MTKKILLVEDDALHQELIFRAFEDVSDMVLIGVRSLREARHSIADDPPDLVVADWRLTDGNGIDLVMSSPLNFPLILMTSFGSEELVVQSMKAGVMDYLVKSPEAFENLPQNVRRALREWDNIQARKAAETALRLSEERYRLAAEGANDIIWYYDPAHQRIDFSGRWIERLQLAGEDGPYTCSALLKRVHPSDRLLLKRAVFQHLREKKEFFSCEFRVAPPVAAECWLLLRGKSLYDEQGRIIRFAGSLTDISVNKKNLARIEELAYVDTVTGLPNRVQFSRHLGAALDDGCVGLLFFIDIDNFKIINDTLGHTFGDQCLRHIGQRLQAVELAGGTVYRLGGDEFIVLVTGQADLHQAEPIAQALMDSFRMPIVMDDNKFYLSVSIGIAQFPAHGMDMDELLKNADTAMYQAKNNGRDTYVVFDKAISQSTLDKMIMGNHLRAAIANDEFRLYYQPQLDVESGNVCGLEALLRWENPHYGFVSPLLFIRLAEELGLIIPIGYWVIDTACRFAAFLYQQHPELYVSINLSSLQLMQVDFVDKVTDIIKRANIPPQMIRFEITESMLMESFDSAVDKLLQLKEIGVKIELDDFGTGYSSLNYLKRLPIETVKIDKTFIDDIGSEQHGTNITDLIVRIAHKIGLKVVAEGVETQQQIELLSHYQCDTVQGFLISKPLPEEEVKTFLRKRG